MKILLVDDDAMLLRSISRVLTSRGYEVICAEGSEAALKAVAGSDHFDVVVSDVDMPVMNGFELKDILHGRCPKLPVILHSGRPQNGVMVKGELSPLIDAINATVVVKNTVSFAKTEQLLKQMDSKPVFKTGS